MRYPVSGSTKFYMSCPCAAVDAANGSCGAVLLVHGTATSTLASRGKTFWLRGFWYNATASGMTVCLADASVGATGVSATGGAPTYYPQFKLNVASFIIGGTLTASEQGGAFGNFQKVEFSAPGIKFSTNCVIYNQNDQATATCGVAGRWGYEE